VRDLLFGSTFGHVDDHCSGPPLAGKAKAAILENRGSGLELEFLGD